MVSVELFTVPTALTVVGDEAIVDRLLRVTKISLRAKNAAGNTALEIAIDKGKVLCVVRLLQHGALDMEEEDEVSRILKFGVHSGSLDVMRVLIDKISDPAPYLVNDLCCGYELYFC